MLSLPRSVIDLSGSEFRREESARVSMSREDLIKVDGTVSEAVSGGSFLVKLTDGKVISAKLSGRLRRFHIRVLAGDRVTIGLSPYDLSHGLILSREKLGPAAGGGFRS